MTDSADQARARVLSAESLKRSLSMTELQEAAGLVERLTAAGLPNAASWAYYAIARTYRRLRRHRAAGCGLLRSMERTALNKVKRAWNRAKAG